MSDAPEIPGNKLRVVVDTQVFLRAGINRRSLPGKVIFDMSENYQLLSTPDILNEVEDVLNRPKLHKKFPMLTDEVVTELVNILIRAESVVVGAIEAVSRDPKDDIFLACAKEGKAHYLVSEDQDLLVLDPYHETHILNVLNFYQIIKPIS